jgi:hypothetical protein
MTRLLFSFSLFMSLTLVFSQNIEAGFNSQELKDLLIVSAHQFDQDKWSNYKNLPGLPNSYKLTYRSPVKGFDNRWDLFTNDKTAIISIRGSVASMESWVENFYAGMIPSSGHIRINDSIDFKYKLAENEKALVHIGWTLGLASMAEDIVEKINNYYAKGYKDFYIIGFSQGASIAQLLNSYLHYLPEGSIPADIQFKTYAIACPKTGNMEYSYDFTYINKGGWEFRVVNREDWVPRAPFTVQNIEDMPEKNPFSEIESALKGMKPMQRSIVKGIYKKLVRRISKAQSGLTNVFGNKVQWVISKSKPFVEKHEFAKSFAYFPAGTNIIIPELAIPADLDKMKAVFYNHMPLNYLKSINLEFPSK